MKKINIFWFFLILAKFVFFCQIFFSEGRFWNFEIMGNRQTQKKILKYCRKNHVLKIYILKYVLKWKMDVIFVIKVACAFGRKHTNRTQVWPFTLKEDIYWYNIFLYLVFFLSYDSSSVSGESSSRYIFFFFVFIFLFLQTLIFFFVQVQKKFSMKWFALRFSSSTFQNYFLYFFP